MAKHDTVKKNHTEHVIDLRKCFNDYSKADTDFS